MADTYKRIAENGGYALAHHLADLHDNSIYLDAFETLLDYYGASR